METERGQRKLTEQGLIHLNLPKPGWYVSSASFVVDPSETLPKAGEGPHISLAAPLIERMDNDASEGKPRFQENDPIDAMTSFYVGKLPHPFGVIFNYCHHEQLPLIA